MAIHFDYRKFERIASLGNLVRLGCSRQVLKHAAARYVYGKLPHEYRKALQEAGISHKILERQIRDARELGRTLALLQRNPRVVPANSTPQQAILCWRQSIEEVADWLNKLRVFRPDDGDAALALKLHVERITGQPQWSEICDLLNDALAAAGLEPNLTPESNGALRKAISRANEQRAEVLLSCWESFALPQKRRG